MPEKQSTAVRPLVMPWERRGRPALTGAWWARALRLDERAAAGLPQDGRAGPSTDDGDAAAVADIRWQRWRDAYTQLTDDALDRQTAEYGCTPGQLRGLLAEAPEELARRVAKPGWARDAERVAATATGDVPARPDGAHHAWHHGFALIVDPFVREAMRLFDAGVADAGPAVAADVAAVRAAAHGEATRRLVRLAGRVLVLELNVLRVTGGLEGGSPEERFWSFVLHYRDPGALAGLLDEYAVLARLLVATAGQVAAVHTEFLLRLAADRPELTRRLFGGTDPGPLGVLRMAQGDTHDGGRSVGIAEFASGRRAVYKPRPLGMHRHFNDALTWLNERLPESSRLTRLTVVDRGEHGWVEFIEPAPCADADAATRYFHRQGVLLALLHCLGGVDFHFENLIAVGDQPVPIDIESLFCAELPRAFGSPTLDGDPAANAYRRSVGRVGLLPSVMIGGDGQVFDAGGMGGDKDSALPYLVADWVSAGTDAMRMDRVQPVHSGSQNRPALDGVDLDALQYAAPLLDGYRTGYAALAAGSGDLLAPDGPLTAFDADRVRVIPRATHEYSTLLSETTHPDVLRDALDREQIFGVLWARSADDPLRSRIVRHEVADLWAGDVPMFSTLAASTDVRAASGAVVADLLPQSGTDLVRSTVAELGERHLADQEWIVAAHVATRVTGVEHGASGGPREEPAGDEALAERALTAARAAGDRLASLAYRDGSRLGWLGLDLWQETRWSVRPLSVDLYNGYAGIALFLAQLARVTGEPRYAALARGALVPVTGCTAELLDGRETPDGPGVISAFSGMTGVAYALASCAVLLDDPALREHVEPILRLAAERVEAETEYDVISGAAGCLAVAEALADDYGTAAHRLAERSTATLLAAARPAGDGLGWPGLTQEPMLGFSHGLAGIGWALLRHARRTGDAAARTAGLRAFAHESGQYDEGLANWPDRRKDTLMGQHTWCHGAPGIGLARADVLDASPEHRESLLPDLRRALDSTLGYGRHHNHSLCHGELGNLEVFAVAGQRADPGSRALWRAQAATAVGRIERDGPVCGTPGGIQTPGLLSGLAGIGHGLLRIAAPDRVAPVLLLAPPRPAG